MAKKATIKKKVIKEDTKAEKPSVIFLDESANKSSSLIYLGVVAVILGFLSTTPLMAKTIFYEEADFIVGMGLVGIVAGIIINNRRRISALFNSKKKT